MLLLIPVASACDPAVLGVLAPPVPEGPEPAVVSGQATSGAQVLAGALVAYDSRWTVEDWARVLFHPEDADLWSPPELGVVRAEKVAPTGYYQLIDLSILWGAIRIQRQTVTGITWASRTGRLENCWQAQPVSRYAEQVQPYDMGADWQEVGLGSWTVEPLPGGGSRAVYQFWTEASLVPSTVMAWGMSRTMPALIRSFDDRVGALATATR